MTRDPRLARWVELLLATPGLTAVASPEDAWAVHVDDALTALPFVTEGPVVDVGSGGGSPGVPLAAARPELEFDLLEASTRKCSFLERATAELPNVRVVCGRAEALGRGAGRDRYAAALARALAPQAVAAEWCLPLVRPGGVAVIYATQPDLGLDAVAKELAAAAPTVVEIPGARRRCLLLFRKLAPTPPGYPRRPGIARKRPLG